MKPRRKKGKTFTVQMTSEGGVPLPVEHMRKYGLNIGDEYIAWQEGDAVIMAFPKLFRGKRRIPKDAMRGRIEPLSPESICAPAEAPAAKVKKPKTTRAKPAGKTN